MTKTLKAKEQIKHAAVRMKEGMIFLGKCHADCFHQAFNVGVKHSQAAKDQGFFTNHGRFVTRLEAHEIALNAGQIDNERPGNILFSEDLWSPVGGGKFKYDSIAGYL